MTERSTAEEIIKYSYKLVISRIPILPFRCRRWFYKSYVQGISDKAFNVYGRRVVEVICFSKGNSKQFRNTNRELDAILEWIPMLEKYRGILREHIRKQRLKYNLRG